MFGFNFMDQRSRYDRHDPKGWCGDPSRGAALGRPSIKGTPEGTISVRRSPLDRQGYDRNGTYFGMGLPLFWVSDEGGEIDFMERATDAEDLAKVLRERYNGFTVEVGEALPLGCWGFGEDVCPDGADADPENGDQCEACYVRDMDAE